MQGLTRISILILSVLIFSCSGKKQVSIPADMLSKEQMVAVLVDIHMLQAILTLNLAKEDEETLKKNPQYAAIFQSHGMTAEQYEKSFKFYSEHSELMTGIYDEVLTELSKKQAEAGK